MKFFAVALFLVCVLALGGEVNRPAAEAELIARQPRDVNITADVPFRIGGSVREFSFREDFFALSANEYNPDLSVLSLVLAMSAFNSSAVTEDDYSLAPQNAVNMLRRMGFDTFRTNEYFIKPTELDGIGVIAAMREIQSDGQLYTLLAVAVRGGGYGLEWGNNFYLGESGHHAGFHASAQKVHAFISAYIEHFRPFLHDNIKLWVTGYSRGGAVANMLAGQLSISRNLAGFTLQPDNIFAYTFNAPRAATNIRFPTLHNIHNVINPSDIVPHVAPAEWGFVRYGVDRYIDSGDITVELTQLAEINIFPPSLTLVSTQEPMSDHASRLIDGLADGGISRENYAAEIQPVIRAIISDPSMNEEIFEHLTTAADKLISSLGLWNLPAVIRAYINDGMSGIAILFLDMLQENLANTGVILPENTVLSELIAATQLHLHIDTIFTLLNNTNAIARAHDPVFMLDALTAEAGR